MSNITIYQSTTDLNDPKLETLVSDCQNIISRGKRAAVELCIKMAETDDYLNTLKKKDKKAKVSMIIETLEIKSVTFYKYAGVGRYVKANPALQDLSMDAIIAHMKPNKERPARHLTAVKSSKPALDAAREAELLKWEAFAHWLSAQMPADQFDKVYNRFCAQYRA